MSLFTRYAIDIDASAAHVWAMLTEPALTRQYMFGCEALSDWKVGSPLLWRGEHEGRPMVFVTGKVVTWQPHALLEYTTFDPNGSIVDVPSNHLTMSCKLTALSPQQTRLELAQGDFSAVENGAARYADATKGSNDAFLAAMKRVAESLK
jgi:uncharacterized protein YndB with AHSA1/START domain